ncbi:MAG TPA: tetratricopeptide repeat protein, partial [Bacillota bacterium]
GKTADASRWLERALAADPNYPPALNNQGNLLLEQGRIDEAYDHYQRALAVDPQYATARHNLAVALRRRGDISGFVREFKRAQRMRVNEQDAELREHRRQVRQEGRSGCLGVLLLVLAPAAVVAIARWL